MFKNGLEILNLISLYLSSNGELCQIFKYISTSCFWGIHENETDVQMDFCVPPCCWGLKTYKRKLCNLFRVQLFEKPALEAELDLFFCSVLQ